MTGIAFISLVAMGLPMAANLVAGGHEVAGFGVDAGRITELAKGRLWLRVGRRGGQGCGLRRHDAA